jgi:hypothetical protein
MNCTMETRTYLPNITFGIITAGKRNAMLNQIVASIMKLGIPNYEILISGEITAETANTISIHFPEAAREGRLGAMRNRILEKAKFETIVIGDDDITYDENFYKALRQYGDNFNIMCPKIQNADGSRYWDWAVYGAPTGHHLIPYNEDSEYTYITGGMCIIRKEITDKVKWNENLGFYENEDISFSGIIKRAGYQLKSNPQAIVIHNDDRITQMEDFNQKIPTDDWINHSSGIRVRGAYLGDPHNFSVADIFDMEIPSDLVDEDLIVSAHLKIMGDENSYYPLIPKVEIFQDDTKIGELQFSAAHREFKMNYEIIKKDTSTLISLRSNALTIGAWNLGNRCRNIESILVSDLSLSGVSGKKYKKSILPEKRKNTQSTPFKGQKKTGIKLVSPLTCANNQTRILLSVLPFLSSRDVEIALEPRICTHETILEMREDKNLWLKPLVNNVTSGTRIELVDQNRIPYENYFKRHASLWCGKNYLLASDSSEFNGILEDEINLFSSKFILNSAPQIKEHPYVMPYKLKEICSSLTPLNISYKPKNFVAIEISTWKEEYLKTAMILSERLKNRLEDLSIILISPEPHFWADRPSLVDRLRKMAISEEINLENLPPITPLEGCYTDPLLFNTYRATDLIINLNEKSHPINFIPSILAKKPILTLTRECNESLVKSLYIETILETLSPEEQINGLAQKATEILNSKSNLIKSCEERYSLYTEKDSSQIIANKLLDLHLS